MSKLFLVFEFKQNDMVFYLTILQHKKAVVLTARVHPGESNSSWMMKGFLDYLCSNSADAKVSI